MKKSSLLAVCLFTILATFGFSPNAHAITLSPVRIELAGNPGETVTTQIKVINDEKESRTLYAEYQNFAAKDETGKPDFVTSTDGLASWMSSPKEITVPADSVQTVPLTVTIPANITPGGHFATLFWRNTPPTGGQNTVSIGAKIGTLVLLRVKGDVAEKIDALTFKKKGGIISAQTPIDIYARFKNAGGDYQKPAGSIVVRNMLGMKSAELVFNREDGAVLPNSVRRYETRWDDEKPEALASDPVEKRGFVKSVINEVKNFHFGVYHARLSAVYGSANEMIHKGTFFLIIPWHLLTVLLVVIGGIWYFYKGEGKKKRISKK